MRTCIGDIPRHPAPPIQAEIHIQPGVHLHGVAAAQREADRVAFFRLRTVQAAPVVFLILQSASRPPAGIRIPRPPARPHVEGLATRLELVVPARPPRPVVVAGAAPKRPVAPDGILEVGVECTEEEVIRQVLRHGEARAAPGFLPERRPLGGSRTGRSQQQDKKRSPDQGHRSDACAGPGPGFSARAPTFHKTSVRGRR